MNTTRRYPRTTQEAFHHTAEYGCAIERPLPLFARTPVASAAIAIVLIFALLILAAVVGGPQP